MFGLPMEIVGPVIGIGAIISFIVAGIVVVRRLSPARRGDPEGEERRVLEDVQARLGELDELKQRIGELEERVDFSERILAKQAEGQRLSPPRS